MCICLYEVNMNELVLEEDLAYILTEFYKTMSDPTRLKIIYSLTKRELCVQDICNAVNMSQTAVSYQLRILRGARIVKFRRAGKQIFYSIDDEHVSSIISLTLEHLLEDK